MSEATASIDGRTVAVRDGQTILQAARQAGIQIPTLCYLEGLRPEGGCRVCLVQLDGSPRPVAACHTPLRPGMRVATRNEELFALRRDILSLYLQDGKLNAYHRDHRDSEFTRLLEDHGLAAPRLDPARAGARLDQSHPYMRFQPALCINCRRCVAACDEVQGQFVYSMAERGPFTHLIYGRDGHFLHSPCVACGACVDRCPTGAISDRDRLRGEAPERVVESVCGYCGVGCRIAVAARDSRVLSITGVAAAAVNRGHLCVKGRYAHAYHHSPERLTQPLLRTDDGFKPIRWEEALRVLVDRLRGVRERHGAQALGVFTSSRSTNEATYLLQKLFRTVIGTNNVDCCARVCHSSTALALQQVTGTGAATAAYEDIDRCGCILLAGANPTEAHPVVGARLKQAVLRGARLIVADPRRIELADYADVHLQLKPGANVALFNALAWVLFDEGLVDAAYAAERLEGFAELQQFLARHALTDFTSTAGVEPQQVRAAARILGAGGPVLFVHGLGLSELTQGTASVKALCNLGMLTGSIGRPGGGMLPLRGQNNVQGSADMGSMPNQLTGYQPVGDPEVRRHVESIWGELPPAEPGLTIPEMLTAAVHGRIRALWIQGEDIAQSDPFQQHVRNALSKLEFLVVQELFMTETARYAHLVLPAAGALEQDGTFTNGERRIQRVRAAVPPPGEARPDWLVARDVARAFGRDWDYPHPGAVMDEIARVAPRLFGGVRYDRLGADGLQWPCPSVDHPGTPQVHQVAFLRGRGQLSVIEPLTNPEHDVAGFPYTLITGRVLNHYNVGTMTRRTPQSELTDADRLEIHPDDAAREALKDNDRVRICSTWGCTHVTVRLSPRVSPGTFFLPFHFPETATNQLIGPHADPDSKCPQYKVTAVRLSPPVEEPRGEIAAEAVAAPDRPSNGDAHPGPAAREAERNLAGART